ncbi:hypothetical protein RJD11_12250 [Bacillus velezensis]|uniref:hypothetical protein n=1 Tax=Bacillus TaxID=1386 RepID=UPI001C533FE3|nr:MULTISPECIES: hypothetical protein [Bacillus amyloliquefaciens group]QXP95484.1 hypothetical protein KVY05_11840 [Bacillus velezensis]QXP99296.1 hypothetical protein KVY05_21260 [Bacillus velezensis]UHH01364.1 hypothetical protein LUA14_12175 [Bacillus amyloliquefaciens]ULR21111.1 hypothetical protein MJE83_12170 [Bacillus velezensis]UVW07854.1 hypothetical protein NX856_12210 [Bacillus velezensis]
MDPKQQAMRNKQRERRQRGNDFEAEIKRSWPLVENVWHMKLKDGGGSTNAADRIVLTNEVNILIEMKRTKSKSFELGFLRQNQIKGLIDFDQVIDRNFGIVTVSFHNPDIGLDETYAFRLTEALKFMRHNDRLNIRLTEFQSETLPAVKIPRINTEQPRYDLKELVQFVTDIYQLEYQN